MENLDKKTIKRVVELLMISESRANDLYNALNKLHEEIKNKNIDISEIVNRLNQIVNRIN